MLIRPVSDLHLEFEQWVLPELPTDGESILMLVGDIGLASKGYTYVPFIETVASRFQEVIMIMGNHEFYNGSITNAGYKIKNNLCHVENFTLLDDESTDIAGVTVIGSTLWSDFNNCDALVMEAARCSMNDYQKIRIGPSGVPYQKKLRPSDTLSLSLTHRKYIFEEIKKAKQRDNKVIVLTHHLPSYLSVPEHFRSNKLNGAYASELFYDIEDTQPELWIHGHTHASVDYPIGEHTRVLCNPKGYPGEINPNFDPTLLIHI